MAVPPAYADGQDWETILSDDVFAQLYLAAPLHAQITDAQVQASKQVLGAFWEQKMRRFITGDRDIEDLYRPGTVNKAPERLEAAATVLASAAGRAACFGQLEARRQEQAGKRLAGYLRPQLVNKIMRPEAIELAVKEGVIAGFTRVEAEQHVPAYLREANFAPIKTAGQGANLLQATWTEGGLPLADQPYTIVLGQKVYSLTEAAQVLYDAFGSTEREKAIRNLDSGDYLENIAKDLKENDVQLDLREIRQDKKLNQQQQRLKALYLLGPGLPFYLDGKPAFANPAQMLSRTAQSVSDFGAAESAFGAGLIAIWVQAAGPAEVKAALPGPNKTGALDFRRFLHKATPGFPLWIGEESFASPAALAAYIRRDENTWKMVYGSLAAGNISPWLHGLGQSNLIERQAQLAEALLGPGLEPNSEKGRQLAVQALLEALDPEVAVPSFSANLTEIDLTGLSGDAPVERTLTLTNDTGGTTRVFLSLEPALDGVRLSATELFFERRASGQQLSVTITGSPAQMPRDGQHEAKLTIRTAYVAGDLPVRAEAVFPLKQFWQFVGGAGLAMAVIFGGVRLLLGQALGLERYARYAHMAGQSELLPLRLAIDNGRDAGFTLVGLLVLLGGLLYFFGRTLRKLAMPTT